MKFRVTMKDPDCLGDAVREAVEELKFEGLSAAEAEQVKAMRAESVDKLCGKWFEYGEYLTVEVDTEAGTCTVVERDR